MNKHARMENFVAELGGDAASPWHPCYAGYFRLFNEGRYYEAHDVLEHLWLACARDDRDYAFYKGLIQLAGAFVHLQKQHARPDHAKDGKRLRPAVRLFALATANLTPYGPRHHGLDVDQTLAFGSSIVSEIVESGFARNPWNASRAPQISLSASGL